MKRHENSATLPLDDRADAYTKSGDMVAAIARRHSHIDMDGTTQRRWHQVMGLMREVDTWADDTDIAPQDVLEGLTDFGMFRERYPDLAPEALGEEAHAAVLCRTERILKLGKRVAEATTPKRFVALRTLEARESVNLFEDIATPHVVEQPAFDRQLMPTLRALGEAATLWDSIIDGKKDKRVGKQDLPPTAEYYARLSGAMLLRARLGGTALLHIEPNVHLGIKVGRRIANRIKNGVPEYSSLRTFGHGSHDSNGTIGK